MKTTKRIKRELTYYLVRIILFAIQLIPRDIALVWAGYLGKLAYHLLGKYRNITINNLTCAYKDEKSIDEIKEMARQVFINMGRNAVDVARYDRINKNNIDQYIRIHNREKFDEAMRRGKGVIAVTAHYGNWEMLAAFFALKNYSAFIVGAPLYFHKFTELVERKRAEKGLNIITRGKGSIRPILRALRSGGILALLSDQDSSKIESVFVDFFGIPARAPIGPVVLASRTGAALMLVYIYLDNKGIHHIVIEDELELIKTDNKQEDIQINTTRYTLILEKIIRRNPTQWAWIHERWKTKQG